MNRADLVYKLVGDLEPVLEQYASSGIEVAVLISKVNDNVVGYQGTKLGKDFLEKETHYTESFRKFCRDYWYGLDNVRTFSSPKKVQLELNNPLADEQQDITFLSASETGAVLRGIDSIMLSDGTKFPISNLLGETEEEALQSQRIIIHTNEDTAFQDETPTKKKSQERLDIDAKSAWMHFSEGNTEETYTCTNATGRNCLRKNLESIHCQKIMHGKST